MARFADLRGREWQVSIDTWSIKVVREAAGFDIGRLLDDGMRRWLELAADPVLLGSVLYALCRDQAGREGVNEEQFHRGLAGEPLADAYLAFEAAFLDFSPSHRRKLLTAVATKEKELRERMTEAGLAELEAIDPARVVADLKKSAGGSGASAGSTPAG